MKTNRHESRCPVVVISLALFVVLLWSIPVQAERYIPESKNIKVSEFRLASASDMSGMPPGKHSRLPIIPPNEKDFFSRARDPFKPPKSDQLCNAGVNEACKVDAESDATKPKG